MNQKNYQNHQSDENRQAALAFNCFQKIGPINLGRLENYFPDLATAFKANYSELERAGLNPKLAADFTSWRRTFQMEKVSEKLAEENINFITWNDPDYPALLKEIVAPPPLLYYKGGWNNFFGEEITAGRLAVVGSRKYSANAEKIINELLPPLISAGLKIISGLALGIDTLTHRAALNYHGQTLAVLGSGLDSTHIYPYTNRYLATEIINRSGLIISEFPPGTPPYKQNFPQRNRIISGLAAATLVVEAQVKSGALITANYALEQNREVLAVPGHIFSEFSAGCNNLIKAGAKMVTGAADVGEIFGLIESSKINSETIFKLNQKTSEIKERTINSPLKPLKMINKTSTLRLIYHPTKAAEEIIYRLLKQASRRGEKLTTDELIKASQLDTAIINSTLSILEIKGVIKNDYGHGGGYELT